MLCLQVLALLLLAPAQGSQRPPSEILEEIRSRGNDAPAALFTELGNLQTAAACEALIDGIASISKADKICTAYKAFSHFRGVAKVEMTAVDYLSERARHSKEKFALHAVLNLGSLWPAAQDELFDLAFEHATADGRSVAIMHLVENGMPLSDKELERLARSKDPMISYEGRLARTARIEDSEKLDKVLVKLAKSKSVVDRLVVGELLATKDLSTRFQILAAQLGDKDARVIRKAISSLERSRHKKAVEVFIAWLPSARPGEAFRISAALQRLTGMMFGSQFSGWKRWWSAEGENFEIPSSPGKPASPTQEHTSASFYGLPIYADRLVFAVDSSKSMNQPAGGGGKTRFEISKSQISNAIEGLPKASAFEIVHFGKNAWSWNGGLVQAKPKSKRDALEYVHSISLSLGTEIYSAFRESFRDPQADSILFMTDGDPQLSLMQNRSALQRIVAQWNRTRHMAIDCIAVGVDRAWLRKLAQQTGGRYSRVE